MCGLVMIEVQPYLCRGVRHLDMHIELGEYTQSQIILVTVLDAYGYLPLYFFGTKGEFEDGLQGRLLHPFSTSNSDSSTYTKEKFARPKIPIIF